MCRATVLSSSLLVPLLLLGCDDDPPAEDAGAPRPDAGPRADAGPFVCSNPAWDPAGDPPAGAASSIDEVVVDRDALDAPDVVPFDPGAVAESGEFPLGVQAGAMRERSALLWTQHTAAGELTLRVWREGDAAGEVRLVEERSVTPADGGFVHAAIDELAPATRYRYAFFTGAAPSFDGRSPIGRFTTALPAGEVARVRVAATACTNQRTRPFEALGLMAEQAPDVFVHLGDMSYNDSALDQAAYRAKWAENLGDEGFRAVLGSAGAYFTWDDHEVTDSSVYYDVPDARRRIATDAFYETLAIEAVERDGERSFWNSYAWGDAVEFIVLDSRSERDPSTRETAAAQYISPEQLAFVEQRLLESPARFKVVLNSVPILGLPLPLWAFEDDRWQGYAAQRQALLDFITDNDIDDVWFLTGDFHMSYVARIETEGPARDLWEIAVGPGGAAGANPVPRLVADGIVDLQNGFPCEQFAYYSGATNVATTVDFDPVAGTVRARFVDADSGDTLFDEVLYQQP